MELFTVSFSQAWQARVRQIEVVDTTVRGSGQGGAWWFAPSWSIVMDHKAGRISDAEYTEEYHRLLSASIHANTKLWSAFIRDPDPKALACYCPYQDKQGHRVFCHRHLLIPVLERLCIPRQIPFIYYGEL